MYHGEREYPENRQAIARYQSSLKKLIQTV